MSLLPNGKIVVGGDFQSIDGISKNHIVRLNANGTIDSTFNIGTGFSGKVTTLSLQPDGKAIAGGAFASYNSLSANNIIRLNTDGSVDSTFNFGNGFNQQVNAITLQHNGKMVIGGNFTTYNTTSTNFFNTY
ncbi:MAG: delta-60 repeat domain-containing protein [Bacteroidetes bacterium]|nr:delta-60 repeat domain-containing protein [Bacteroidota bacterium]